MSTITGKGTVVSVTPTMQNDEHAKYKDMYKFTAVVDADDGKQYSGGVLAKKNTTPYGPNDSVEFEYTPNQYGGKMSIKKIKEERSEGDEMSISRQVAVECAISMSSNKNDVTPEKIIQVADKFTGWLIGNSVNVDPRACSNALRRGTETYNAGLYDSKKYEEAIGSTIILNIAKAYLDYYFKK